MLAKESGLGEESELALNSPAMTETAVGRKKKATKAPKPRIGSLQSPAGNLNPIDFRRCGLLFITRDQGNIRPSPKQNNKTKGSPK
jgi:hypothetical protein